MTDKQQPAKSLYSPKTMISLVAAETTIAPYLLAEDEELAALWNGNATLAELIEYANENY